MTQTPSATPAPQTRRSTMPPWLPLLFLPFLHLAAALPLIVLHINRSRGAYDSVNYHEKMIRDFISQWPRPDFHDYLSVTTPLYHVLLAGVGRYFSDSVVVLKLVGMTFTLGLLGLLTWACGRRTQDWRQAVANASPVAACVYVFSAGVWLLPDNAGWLGCVAILILALRPRFDWVTVVAGGGILLLLVLTRQIHLWAATPLVIAAWLGTRPEETWEGARGVVAPPVPATYLTPTPARLARAGLVLVATLPAIAALGYFVWLWGGLTPPSFRAWFVQPYNAATPAFILMLFGLCGTFFAVTLLGPLARLARANPGVLALVLLAAFLVCALPHTSRDPYAGRYSALWDQLATRPPNIRDRSPAVIFFGVLGAVWLAAAFSAIALRERLILLSALAGFALAQTASFWVWQRYTEPMVLIFLALLASSVVNRSTPHAARWKSKHARNLSLIGPLALASALAAITVVTITYSGVVKDEGFVPGKLEPPPKRPVPANLP